MDQDEQDMILKAHKKKDVKLNNSFTGPYPQDPTDFNHTDKGANAQFLHYNRILAAKKASLESKSKWAGDIKDHTLGIIISNYNNWTIRKSTIRNSRHITQEPANWSAAKT